jgi:signal transduction histidine kinase
MTITSRTAAAGLPRSRDTERRRKAELERRISEQAAQLQAAQREIDVLCHAIAHDLRSPLRTIASGAQILLEESGRLGDEAREWTGRIAAAANRMDTLVLGLLDYAGLTEPEAKLQMVDPGAVVRDVLARMAPAIAQARAKVVVDGPLPPVRAHVRSLDQAIATLLSNALKFAREGVAPKVRIRSERRGRSVRLWVDDNGIGIPPEHQHRLFGVFERLQRRERFGGAGIGLAVAKRLVERMGGAVGVKSEPGRGSSFFLDLTGA